MVSTLALAGVLMAASIGLLLWHVRAWRQADNGALADEDYRFYRRQLWRRVLASTLLGITGLLMLGERWIENPVNQAIYWVGIAGLVGATAVLALTDWLASRVHFSRQVADHATEHALLRAEIERFRREARSEKPDNEV
jgi:hypothetical protein